MSVVASEASAQGYNVGDAVECDGRQIGIWESGRVIAIIPRPGWPDPFYEVQPDNARNASFKCVAKFMRPGGGGGGGAAAGAPQAPAGQMPPPAPAAPGQPAPAGAAASYQVGDKVMCDGTHIGTWESAQVIAVIPRPGWPDPFYEVQPDHGGSPYKCTAKYMRPGGGGQGAAAPPPPAPPPAAPPAQMAAAPQAPAANLCVPGAKVEVSIGITWYVSTVTGPPTADGRCPIRRDNYDDLIVGMGNLRPAGAGPATLIPKQAGTPAAPGQAAPDGTYACDKMAGMGTAMSGIGQVDVRGGVPTFRSGLPDGWTLRQIKYEGTDGQGRHKIVVDYTSKAGFNDRLDCFPK